MAVDFLAALQPPLSSESMEKLKKLMFPNNMGLKLLAALGPEGLRELSGLSLIENARVISALGDLKSCFAPPPLGPNGEPVVVRPKIGFTNFSQVDTVTQTLHCRFYLDLYWHDPRVIG